MAYVNIAKQMPAAKREQSWIVMDNGRLEEALDLYRKTIALDPLNATTYGNMARTLTALGRLDEAEQVARKVAEITPNPQRLATPNPRCRSPGKTRIPTEDCGRKRSRGTRAGMSARPTRRCRNISGAKT